MTRRTSKTTPPQVSEEYDDDINVTHLGMVNFAGWQAKRARERARAAWRAHVGHAGLGPPEQGLMGQIQGQKQAEGRLQGGRRQGLPQRKGRLCQVQRPGRQHVELDKPRVILANS